MSKFLQYLSEEDIVESSSKTLSNAEKQILEKVGDKKIRTAELTKTEMKTVWKLVDKGFLKYEEGEKFNAPYTKTRNFGKNSTKYDMYVNYAYISKIKE